MSKILIASADFNLTTMMEARLLMDGYEVFKAEDGLSALQKVQELKPQLIIVDAVLPKISGHRLIEKAKALPDFHNTPIFVITGQGWIEELFRKTDVFYFCSKPIFCTEFMEKVALALKSVKTEKTPQVNEAVSPSSADRGLVLLAGPQEFIVNKVKELFVSKGFNVELCADEGDVVQKAAKMKPDYIFIQYWDNSSVFNARKVESELAKKPELRAIPLYVFSQDKNASYARDFMSRERVISFYESPDLLDAFKRLFFSKKKDR